MVDELYNEIDNAAVQQELFEKRQKLLNFREMCPYPPTSGPSSATTRKKVSSGCTSSMNSAGAAVSPMTWELGKTLQILTFLQEQKNRLPAATSLVVLPVTLLYNWQAEAEKFCLTSGFTCTSRRYPQVELNMFDEFGPVLTTGMLWSAATSKTPAVRVSLRSAGRIAGHQKS